MATRAFRPDPDHHRLFLVQRPQTRRINRGIALLWAVIILIGGSELGFAVYGFLHACTVIGDKLEGLIP